MYIHVLTKDVLEAQGIKWMISSQIRDVEIVLSDSLSSFKEAISTKQMDFLIIDMDVWPTKEDTFLPSGVAWLGLSSERTFQTAYRALQHKAQDVLFRPFQPDHLIKHVQQARFQWRNQNPRLEHTEKSYNALTYTDLLLTDRIPTSRTLMSTVSTSDEQSITQLVQSLKDFHFTTTFHVFPFSSYILCVHEVESLEELKNEYQSFFAHWSKTVASAKLAIHLHVAEEGTSYKSLYQKMRRYHERIFFDGYDILTIEQDEVVWTEMDPFLTPIEQRFWIEMLEKRELKAIKEWIEQDFLTLQEPYPDPEMVRVRLTSVLAQVRRYMTAQMLTGGEIEKAYHEIFQEIVRGHVMYRIIQQLIEFITTLLREKPMVSSSSQTFSGKVRTLMESNYWNPDWNLAACAEMLRINKSTLSRKFSQSNEGTFRDSLHEIRIREAKRLLKETAISLDEVARLTGYTHQTYFNAKFKAATGQTPLQYRYG